VTYMEISLALLPPKAGGEDVGDTRLSILPSSKEHFIWLIVAPPNSGM